ncbi:MAG: PhzF family phenazine biosynthesis protein [Holosporales bacterium]|jgi:PhzF family phenazine biosynthesis protein|nr:PhzF family phenazine biosynthesis protein [Holosporales bacterium]
MVQQFWIVDTFSKRAFGGTPSAVFFTDERNNDDLLQNIAMEINTPETIFIRSVCDGKFEAECFTPYNSGMYFGNSVFAAAHVIFSQDPTLEKVTITCRNIDYEVSICDNGEITVRFASKQLEKVSTPVNLSSALGGVIIVSIAKCGGELIVEVRSPSKLANLLVNANVLNNMGYDSFVVTTDAHYNNGDVDYDFCANVYAPKLGIFRNIMTPISIAALAKYWHVRMAKSEMVGAQISSTKCGRAAVRIEHGDSYVTGNCAVMIRGSMLVNLRS